MLYLTGVLRMLLAAFILSLVTWCLGETYLCFTAPIFKALYIEGLSNHLLSVCVIIIEKFLNSFLLKKNFQVDSI